MSMKRKIILSLGVVALMLVTCFASVIIFNQNKTKTPSDNTNTSASKPTTYTYSPDQLVFKSGSDFIEYEYLPNAGSAVTQGTTTAYEYHFTNVSTVDQALDLNAIEQPSGLTITYATYNESKNDNISSIVSSTSFSIKKITPGQDIYAYILITPNTSLTSTFTTSVAWKQGEAIEVNVIKSDTGTEGTPILAIKGEQMSKPDDPTAGLDDYYFDDWFLDENYTKPATFPMQAVETLYARFANLGADYISGNSVITCTQEGSIVIPSQYNGTKITTISNGAFASQPCTNISLPYTMITIEDSAFNCASVTSVDFSACLNLTSIGAVTFGETSIASVDLSMCIKLTDISGAFNCATGLEDIKLPNSITTIGSQTFWGCAFTTITLPSSITTIGEQAFIYSSLTSIVIPEGVTTIPAEAFSGCTNLQSVTLPSTITSIGNNAFYDCSSLTSINLNACTKLTSIGNSVFYGCVALENITLPQGITSIGSSVFNGCTSLVSIIMPNGVTKIGQNIFGGCTSLTTMFFEPTEGTWYQSTSGYSNGTEYDLGSVVTDVTLFKTSNYWYKQ